jgi:hypothetical protein
MLFCILDGQFPCVVTDAAAWFFIDGRWQELNLADASMNAAIVGMERFLAVLRAR